ncbi:phosphodiester glycosidase family protein [Hoeflea sp.]|uniref:phosphodiester glycosidase family protein n=1 Tax=Hoeflea sp. TaxID=1940281 RepID=UPI003BAFFE6B
MKTGRLAFVSAALGLAVIAAGAAAALLLAADPVGVGRQTGDRNQSGGEADLTGTDWPDGCREEVFEGARAILCVVDASVDTLRLVYRTNQNEVLGTVSKASERVRQGLAPRERFVLAMNAGMYHADMEPVGLYVEEGAEIAPLNREDGFGNFFLKPNGVFFVRDDGSAGVLETDAYVQAEVKPAFGTQSGPMLVIDGAIHPRFLPDGTSKFIRNGVGVRTDGTVVFAITRDKVSLGSFARLFRNIAGCENALFFDGAVSSLALGGDMVIDSGEPAGPVVVVIRRSNADASSGPPEI